MSSTSNQSVEGHPDGTLSGHGNNNLPQRYLWLLAGILINSFAIELITRSNIGTSPISSLPLVLSEEETMFTFGETTIFVNACFILIQIALLRRDFQPIQLLQFPVTFIFGWFIDFSSMLLSWLVPTWLPVQILVAVAGSLLLAFGISIEIAPQVITAPGEGAVRAISYVSHIRFGTVKIAFDLSLCVLAIVFSLIFFGEIRALGLGTVIAAVLTGRGINFFNQNLGFLAKISKLAE